jgi:sporulation protein YlmC with PRC-barrel domain
VTSTRIYVARLTGLSVFDPNGDLVGRVRDVVARQADPPHVVGLVAELPLRRRIFLPIGRVQSIDAEAVVLGTGKVSLRRFEKRPGEILVLQDLLDRQVTIVDRRRPSPMWRWSATAPASGT